MEMKVNGIGQGCEGIEIGGAERSKSGKSL